MGELETMRSNTGWLAIALAVIGAFLSVGLYAEFGSIGAIVSAGATIAGSVFMAGIYYKQGSYINAVRADPNHPGWSFTANPLD